MTKEQVRQSLLEKRQALSEKAVQDLSSSIQDKLFKSPLWPKKGRVGLYAPVRNEVMTQTLFQNALESGLHVYFPRVEQGINFYEVNGPDDLQRGSWSIPEPKLHCELLSKSQGLDLLVVPGIAFTADGHRIGYGRGFYDKYIEARRPNGPIIALAYDFQIVEGFPSENWDQPLDGIITEKRLITQE